MSRGISFWVARMLGWASTVSCLIVAASFLLFVVNQSHAATVHQQNEIVGTGTGAATTSDHPSAVTGSTGAGSSSSRPGSVHRFIDEAAAELTSPFSGLTSSWHSQWRIEIVLTLLGLLVYGVILRYVMRSVALRA